MNKFIKFFAFIIFIGFFALAGASSVYAEDFFNTSLSYGSSNTAEVIKLQQFLFDQGYLLVAPTGNFLSLTRQAVVDFQKANNIVPALGYFGPLTRAVANAKLGSLAKASITPGEITTETSQTGAAILSSSKTIRWSTTNYPTGAGVNLNLIRKTSSSPNSYTLVRVLAENTANDGLEMWPPKSGESTNDLYVEITCSSVYKYQSGCQMSGEPTKVN